MLSSIDHWDWKVDAPEFVPTVWAPQGTSAAPAPCAPASQPYDSQNDQALCIDGGAAQLKAQFEWQMQVKDQQIQQLEARLLQIEKEDALIKSQWDHDRSNLLWQIDRHSDILKTKRSRS